jgi:hypothetical protein
LDSKLRAEYDGVLKDERPEIFFDDLPARTESEENLFASAAKSDDKQSGKEQYAKESDWWFHAMYSEIEEIYRNSLRTDFESGTRLSKPKPFTENGQKKSTGAAKNRFRRASIERLWMDRGLN